MLAGGEEVGIRPIQPDDAARLQRFHARLSQRSIYYRFFGVKPRLGDRQAKHFAEVDYTNRFALVAFASGEPDEIIGVARFDRLEATDEAELGIVIADRYQGQGLGRAMLSLLIEAARARGIRRLFALVLADNVRMIGLLRRLGYPHHETWENETERIWLDLDDSPG